MPANPSPSGSVEWLWASPSGPYLAGTVLAWRPHASVAGIWKGRAGCPGPELADAAVTSRPNVGLHRLPGGSRSPHDPVRDARCSSISEAMPRAASASIASSSVRRNAWPSAVPWISMNPPASFITTFMSVSASESSA